MNLPLIIPLKPNKFAEPLVILSPHLHGAFSVTRHTNAHSDVAASRSHANAVSPGQRTQKVTCLLLTTKQKQNKQKAAKGFQKLQNFFKYIAWKVVQRDK